MTAISLGTLRKAAKARPAAPWWRFECIVLCHPTIEPAVRDLPNFFVPSANTATKMLPNEIGRVEIFRFVLSDDAPIGAWAIDQPDVREHPQ